MTQTQTLEEKARQVLLKNDRGQWTVPAEGLYPHQWLWDSCFTAIGLRHIDPERAATELRSLLRGQWQNGMIPHMIFSPTNSLFDDGKLWRSSDNPLSPRNVATSGITQPPLIAEATRRVYEKLFVDQRTKFLKEMVPAIIRHHEWLYRERDPHANGLVFLFHPWETGLDNSPAWAAALKRVHTPLWVRIFDYLHLDILLSQLRRDIRRIPADQRMKTSEALRLWHTMRDLRRRKYDTLDILAHGHRHFIVSSVSFNSMLIRNNTILTELASEADIQLPGWLRERFELAKNALHNLCNPVTGVCYHHDYDHESFEEEPSISVLLPLYSGAIPAHQAEQLVGLLTNPSLFWTDYPVPSTPLSSEFFSEKRYWQGPTWLNTNWLLIDGLSRYGFTKEAERVRQASLSLVEQSGMYEYFSPINGSGYGSADFSWTAACTLDLLHRST
jgi:hypothetical protein